ncbi:MAG: multicopper oxidase domain-containing protein [Deltaproteobacteria bacterium]|nr:multicopper oxidase domain-containing protein [Deltaproteobacteria bacterium]
MKKYQQPIGLKSIVFGLLGFFAASATCQAADVYLVAKPFIKPMPDGAQITMWGFAADADGNLATDGGETATVPGPMITVAPTDPVLNIHLRNDLAEEVSLVIPGQTTSMTPVKFIDGTGRERVRSFTFETAPGATGTYTWNNLRPGTYIYQSGTHPAVQVQMGLYGAAIQDTSAGSAYPGVPYVNEMVLFYSEIDPALHAAVTGGTYGTAAYPSTIDYQPSYFLINGAPYPAATPVVDHKPKPGETLLIRFLSAALKDHVPVLVGPNMSIVAEDGNLYPYAREQYSVLLSAGKTLDAVVAPPKGKYSIYDRMLDLTNGAATGNGGMQTQFFVNGCNGDLNNSGNVNVTDFSLLLADWGKTNCSSASPCNGDINNDGFVNAADYSLLLADWGKTNCLTP